MQRILVCDDSHEIVETTSIYLTGEGFKVLPAYDGAKALEIMEHTPVGLLIVGAMMPDLDGIRTVRQVQGKSSIPIIVLSTKSEDNDKILGLNIDAGDYLTKPFSPLELMARIKSQLRCYTELDNMDSRNNMHLYTVGDLMINDGTKEVRTNGDNVELTPIEYDTLLLLIKNADKVFSIDEAYEKIQNEEAIGADDTVAVYTRHIREKIEINLEEPRHLKVIQDVGYKVEKKP